MAWHGCALHVESVNPAALPLLAACAPLQPRRSRLFYGSR
ncbi:hypothetical protein HMPREF0762_02063 [Slackia exigua ATCC 700122]|uniref:Uncharacterized protein n=1 Tax=Slackia exigua (strain ATCC 700122 / DSM 15923 / CIP 105133 / JCM 11022 / KCTC 5966 / S-7) TaxID=649764 RepID=D0WJN6_SLAES|nr:hypothetical protein HMPREF0762_02063 [Slackia exigua ATCC 700122]